MTSPRGEGTSAAGSNPDTEYFDDPTAGLVTGADGGFDDRSGPSTLTPPRIPVARPVEPDEQAVRDMVEASLRQDAPAWPSPSAPPAPAPALQFGGQPSDFAVSTEVIPPAGVIARPVAEDDAGEEQDAEKTPGKEEKPKRIRLGKPKVSRGSAGVLVAVLLMIVFAVVAIEFLATFIESISSIFH